jgi:hypothetical protein
MTEVEDKVKVLEADLKVANSRAEAYRRTCDVHGRKLVAIQNLLMVESNESKQGLNADVHIAALKMLHWDDCVLRAIADILNER